MRKGASHYISVYLGFAMMIVVVVLAVMLIFTDMWIDRMNGGKRTFMILLLLAYAVYRGFRIYSVFRSRGPENFRDE
jgi:hypothetical protein